MPDRDACAGVGLELREDVAHVALDRLLRDEELRCNVAVREPSARSCEDLPARGAVSISLWSLPERNDGISAGST
jgi:hypothetical protein